MLRQSVRYTLLVLLFSELQFWFPFGLLDYKCKQKLLTRVFLGLRDCFTLKELGEFVSERFYTTAEQVHVFVALLEEKLCSLHSVPFIVHVHDDQLIRLVLEAEQLWDRLIPRDVGSWVAERLLDPPGMKVIRVS